VMARTRVRWGRVSTLALVAGLGVGVLIGRAHASGQYRGAEDRSPQAVRVVEVRPGDTIWGIARDAVGPEGDPRPIVDAVIAANHLRTAEILPGQRLLVPAGP
ncbi:MAG: LysM peptidoglycan-binding domain-containing protein, partial [Actinomycetota bacterium]